jgi:hypothetical protein
LAFFEHDAVTNSLPHKGGGDSDRVSSPEFISTKAPTVSGR